MKSIQFLAAICGLVSFTQGQLSGTVGPQSTFAAKARTKVCNVLNYGAVADGKTDLGPALNGAWVACRKGGLVYVPAGTYAMASWVSLRQGAAAAIQLDGTIVRTGTAGGNMISIEDSDDFEFFSGNSKGAFQGYGYQYISQGQFGARFMRFTNVHNFSIHGIALVDSASYYLVFDSCSNGEIYNLILRGIRIGETDGIDIWGDNIWVHDVEVTNGDECVTIKSPSTNMLIEDIYCNISGGCAIGSLGLDTTISDIHYRNIYANQADPAYLKTNGGTGSVSNILWENVIVWDGAYVLALNEAWGTDRGGEGIKLDHLTFRNWHGTNADAKRPVVRLECDDQFPCTYITLENVNLWNSAGRPVTWSCQSAHGSGGCLRSGGGAYAISYSTVATAPPYQTSTMPNDHKSAFPSTASFTIPPVPTTFFPGAKPASALLNLRGAGGLAKRAEPTDTV